MTEPRMPETHQNTSGWEIATACDIHLGSYFQEGGPYADQQIDVYPRAIDYDLAKLDDSGQPGKLLFEVTGLESVRLSSDRRPETDTSQVIAVGNVAVKDANGEPIERVDADPSETTVHAKVSIERCLILDGHNKRINYLDADSLEVGQTVIHELQHVVDTYNNDVYNADEQFIGKLNNGIRKKIIGGAILCWAGIIMSMEAVNLATNSAPASVLIGSTVGLGIGYVANAKADQIQADADQKISYELPREVRAYAVEDMTQELPAVIAMNKRNVE